MIIQSKAYSDVISFMIEGKSPEEIIAFKASDALNERVLELVNKQKNGIISKEENKELDQYMWLEDLMRLAKARARKLTKVV